MARQRVNRARQHWIWRQRALVEDGGVDLFRRPDLSLLTGTSNEFHVTLRHVRPAFIEERKRPLGAAGSNWREDRHPPASLWTRTSDNNGRLARLSGGIAEGMQPRLHALPPILANPEKQFDAP